MTKSTMKECPTCGNIRIDFDPPLRLTAHEACGAIKTADSQPPIPVCDLPAGHEGKHEAIIEYTDTWEDR